jgi:uncharacterized membrane protein YgcG
MIAAVLGISTLARIVYGSPVLVRQLPALGLAVNDFAHMLPAASHSDLTQRLKRFRVQTGHTVSILTVPYLEEGETVEALAAAALTRLPLEQKEASKAFILVVARKEHLIGFAAGAELKPRFPTEQAAEKLQSHLDLYINGLRPDLGIYGALHFVQGVISGEFRVNSTTEEEALENTSLRGGGAGAIFSLLLAPFLAFFASMLLGVYSKSAGFQRETRLFLGTVVGGGTAQLVGTLMAMIGPYGSGLWYFIIIMGMILGAFASLTEYWMKDDWIGIPRVKEKFKRKPEDNIGI